MMARVPEGGILSHFFFIIPSVRESSFVRLVCEISCAVSLNQITGSK